VKSLDSNYTDALVASDEWENFDYNLRLQIEELARIDYDKKPEKWKRNTLAYGYLWHVEKLLRETGTIDNYTLNTIKELKKVITKYEGTKILLLTLRLATIVMRAGIIPEMAQFGYKTKKRSSDAGLNSWGSTPKERKKRNDYIQNEINRLCNKGHSFRGACKITAKNVGLSAEYIRKKIAKKPPPLQAK